MAWALLLLIAGAALAVWGLARWDGAARFLGVAPQAPFQLQAAPPPLAPSQPAVSDTDTSSRVAALEQRLASIENTSRQAAGSAGRADGLLIAFAARRAIERGAPLGYLEPLLVQRFEAAYPRQVATVVTVARNPVTLDQLIDDYAALEPALRRGPPDESLWDGFRRELGTLVAVHRSNAPSPMAEARYDRAAAHLERGDVDSALAETMRLPGAERGRQWIADARRYVAAQRALDAIESAALLARAD